MRIKTPELRYVVTHDSSPLAGVNKKDKAGEITHTRAYNSVNSPFRK